MKGSDQSRAAVSERTQGPCPAPSLAAAEPAYVGMENPETGDRRAPDEHAFTPRQCDLWDIATPVEGGVQKAELVEDFNRYLEGFAAPVPGRDGGYLCFHCAEPLTGDLTAQLFGRGGFEWGIAHGEGHCRCCRWPARLYHFIKDRDGEHLATIRNIPLSYRPAEAAQQNEVSQ